MAQQGYPRQYAQQQQQQQGMHLAASEAQQYQNPQLYTGSGAPAGFSQYSNPVAMDNNPAAMPGFPQNGFQAAQQPQQIGNANYPPQQQQQVISLLGVSSS